MTVQAYKLFVQPWLKAWLIFGGIVTIVMPGVIFFMGLRDGEPPLFVAALPLVVFAMPWYQVSSTTHTINIRTDQGIEFISLLRTRTIQPSQIKSIKPAGGQFGWLCVRHSNGKIALIQQFTGFHQFLSELREVNPQVELVGC